MVFGSATYPVFHSVVSQLLDLMLVHEPFQSGLSVQAVLESLFRDFLQDHIRIDGDLAEAVFRNGGQGLSACGEFQVLAGFPGSKPDADWCAGSSFVIHMQMD